MVTLMAGTVTSVAASSPAQAAPCTQQTGVSVSDPNTGKSWSSYWWCPNAGNAVMYGDATPNTPTAQMVSTNSWFVCYRRGYTHAGGNDVWYYSQGDISMPGMGSRQGWGYMPASSVYTHIDPWPGIPLCQDNGYSPPQNLDGRSTVLMVHGYHPDAAMDCNWWNTARNTYTSIGYNSSQLIKIKFYDGDKNCSSNGDIRAAPNSSVTENTSIATIGALFAWYIYNNFSRWGKSVDVIAHSMGGLVTRAAITGTANPWTSPFNAYSWPPYLYVRDVSTIATPFEGGYPNTVAGGCIAYWGDLQCREMVEGHYFIQNWIKPYGNPQAWWYNGRGGTDWTLIGSVRDEDVVQSSSLELHSSAIVGHKITYTYGSVTLDHMGIWAPPIDGSYRHYYCDYYNPCDQSPPFCLFCEFAWDYSSWNYNGAAKSPLEVAAWGNYYATGR